MREMWTNRQFSVQFVCSRHLASVCSIYKKLQNGGSAKIGATIDYAAMLLSINFPRNNVALKVVAAKYRTDVVLH